MKKRKYLLSLLLGAALLSGCAATPDSSIVRQKGSQSLDNYSEADAVTETEEESSTEDAANGETQSISGVEVSTGNRQDISDGDSTGTSDTNISSAENALASRLGVPETYTAEAATADGSFILSCDAVIDVPNVTQVPVYTVSQKDFSQDFINLVTEAFFEENPVYDQTAYMQTTKAEALDKLEELKAYQASGNNDPYGYIEAARKLGMFEDGSTTEDEVFNLQEEIDEWEQIYAKAVDEAPKNEITPGFGVYYYTDADGNAIYYDDLFLGTVEMDDSLFCYKLKRSIGWPMEITITRYPDKEEYQDGSSIIQWKEVDYDAADIAQSETGYTSLLSRDECEEMAGITVEAAIEVADTYMEKLGLTDFSASYTSSAMRIYQNFWSANPVAICKDAGWYLVYTRTIDGIPVTYETNQGGGLESMESTTEPWAYEWVEFYVNADGLQEVTLLNLYDIGEKKYENVSLLSFEEIAEIFEQMIVIQNTDTGYASSSLEITEVKLGYMRIYDPGADNTGGTLVPVWDFFGVKKTKSVYDGVTYDYVNASSGSSYLTINAADGTIIDRSLGY